MRSGRDSPITTYVEVTRTVVIVRVAGPSNAGRTTPLTRLQAEDVRTALHQFVSLLPSGAKETMPPEAVSDARLQFS